MHFGWILTFHDSNITQKHCILMKKIHIINIIASKFYAAFSGEILKRCLNFKLAFSV